MGIEHQLYYISADPVHQAQVEKLVAELGGEVTDDPRRMSACLVDHDFLPLELHARDLLKVLSRYPACPTAVHGYNLSDDDRHQLASHGILTFRRLNRACVAKLFA
jgi:hypothetical protein